MKKLLLFCLLVFSAAQAQVISIQAGRTPTVDTVRWGDADDSTSLIRARGNAIARDSAGTYVTITTDSCSLPVELSLGTQMPNSKLELSYEVRASSGNTDSTQVKWKIDSRYCKGVGTRQTCDTWVPAGRFLGDTASAVMDSIISKATASGVTWMPTRQLFDVPGGTQIRLCVDSYKAGGAAGDTTFFRRHVVRTSSVPAGGVPPGAGGGGAGTSVDVLTIAAGDNNIGNVDVVTLPNVTVGTFPDNEPFNVAQINGVTPLMGNGATGTGSLRVTIADNNTAIPVATHAVTYATTGSGTATGALRVELPTNGTGVIATVGAVTAITNALPAGTNAIGKLAANNGVDIGDVDVASVAGNVSVVGPAAHDAAISGAPVRIGGRALTADYTAVSTGEVADAVFTVDGKQITKPFAIRASTWTFAGASGGITNTTAATMKAAAASGIRNCLTSIQVVNGHATVSTEVLVKDGAGGTVIHRGWAQAAGGGYAATFEVPICGTAATLMEVVPVTTGSAIYVNAQGFISAD